MTNRSLSAVVIDELLSMGSDVKVVTTDGYSLLYMAVKMGDIIAVRLLLENQADPSVPCKGESIISSVVRLKPPIDILNTIFTMGGCSLELLAMGTPSAIDYANGLGSETSTRRAILYYSVWPQIRILKYAISHPEQSNLPTDVLRIILTFVKRRTIN